MKGGRYENQSRSHRDYRGEPRIRRDDQFLLHDASAYIVGRMGVPYRERGISLISVALDAPQDVISALSGRIGALPGVTAKTVYSNVISDTIQT